VASACGLVSVRYQSSTPLNVSVLAIRSRHRINNSKKNTGMARQSDIAVRKHRQLAKCCWSKYESGVLTASVENIPSENAELEGEPQCKLHLALREIARAVHLSEPSVGAGCVADVGIGRVWELWCRLKASARNRPRTRSVI